MLMCRGNGCNWKHVCSRYVLGRGIAATTDISVEMRDHCPHHQQDFIAVNSEEGRRVAAMVEASKSRNNKISK